MKNDATSGGSHTFVPEGPSPLFLTGGSGYLGRNLIRHFTGKGVDVVALVRSQSSADVVRALGATPVMGQLSSPALSDAMKGCSSLIHAAACTSHGPETPEHVLTNVEGTRTLFAMARLAGVRRAVHVSTESVLLDGRGIVNADESQPMPSRFPGAYSRTKAEAERIVRQYSGNGLDAVIVRPRFIWGRDDTTALPILRQAARSRKMAWINGGEYLTSTTHIANACHGIELALLRGHAGEAYFITDGAPMPFRTFVSRLLETQGVEVPQKTVPLWLVSAVAHITEAAARLFANHIKPPVTRQDLATMAVEVTLNIAKARRDLGYTPRISTDEGMAELKRLADKAGTRTP